MSRSPVCEGWTRLGHTSFVEKLSIPCANRGVFAELSLAQPAQLVHASAELLFALFRKFWFEV